jgi:hypothetical protein
MDPLTIGLVIAAVAAGLGIKRAAAPPAPVRSPEAADEAPSPPSGFPAPAFGGALRPPVTHRMVSQERNVEGSRDEKGERGDLEPEPARATPAGALAGISRAAAAVASSSAPDVAGVAVGSRGDAPRTEMQVFSHGPLTATTAPNTYTTPTGVYIGQTFYPYAR